MERCSVPHTTVMDANKVVGAIEWQSTQQPASSNIVLLGNCNKNICEAEGQ